MSRRIYSDLENSLKELEKQGLYKSERQINSPQSARVTLQQGKSYLNFCSNNYLGLANNPEVIQAAKDGLDSHGFGLSSVRFICGTQDIHKELEERVSRFLGMEDTILYSSCFDANAGLFETILGKEDAIFSDSLNHASIIDGVRLCKAERFRYPNNDLEALEELLKKAHSHRYRLIATDGVFSMDGSIAKLEGLCDLAERYDALLMVDDSHASGFVGKKGRGTAEYANVMGRIDLITSTFGKALGGASGGFLSGNASVISWARQRSRPYLFSNSLSPAVVSATLKVFDLLENSDDLRIKLQENTRYFRQGLEDLGFSILPGEHPIIAVMLGDAKLAQEFAKEMLEQGVYVVGFSYPVVPRDKARIRVQISAAHEKSDLKDALKAFAYCKEKLLKKTFAASI